MTLRRHGSLLCIAQGRDRSGDTEQRFAGRDQGDYAASTGVAMAASRPTTKWKRRTRVDRLAHRFVHRARGVHAHARYPVGVAVEAERLIGGM